MESADATAVPLDDLSGWSERVENFMADGELGDAERLLLRVVKILDSRENANVNLILATALSDLGHLYCQQALSLRAEPFFQRALSIRVRAEKLGGGTNREGDGDANMAAIGLNKLDLGGGARNAMGGGDYAAADAFEEAEEDDWESEWDSGRKELPVTYAKPSAGTPDGSEPERVQRRGRGMFTYGAGGSTGAPLEGRQARSLVSDTSVRGRGGHPGPEDGAYRPRAEAVSDTRPWDRDRDNGGGAGTLEVAVEDKAQKRGRGAFKYSSGDWEDEGAGSARKEGSVTASISGQLPNRGEHILEVFGFSPTLTTSDLENLVAPYRTEGVSVRWVDDTHALAVFATPDVARRARQNISDPRFRLRPFADASPPSLRYKSPRELEPPVPRPKSSARVAQRLIVGALRDSDVTRNMRANGMLDATTARKLEAERRQRLSMRHALQESAWGDD